MFPCNDVDTMHTHCQWQRSDMCAQTRWEISASCSPSTPCRYLSEVNTLLKCISDENAPVRTGPVLWHILQNLLGANSQLHKVSEIRLVDPLQGGNLMVRHGIFAGHPGPAFIPLRVDGIRSHRSHALHITATPVTCAATYNL